MGCYNRPCRHRYVHTYPSRRFGGIYTAAKKSVRCIGHGINIRAIFASAISASPDICTQDSIASAAEKRVVLVVCSGSVDTVIFFFCAVNSTPCICPGCAVPCVSSGVCLQRREYGQQRQQRRFQ